MGLLEQLKQIFAGGSHSDSEEKGGPRRRDSDFGRVKDDEVQDLPPERAAELAGHATERVDT